MIESSRICQAPGCSGDISGRRIDAKTCNGTCRQRLCYRRKCEKQSVRTGNKDGVSSDREDLKPLYDRGTDTRTLERDQRTAPGGACQVSADRVRRVQLEALCRDQQALLEHKDEVIAIVRQECRDLRKRDKRHLRDITGMKQRVVRVKPLEKALAQCREQVAWFEWRTQVKAPYVSVPGDVFRKDIPVRRRADIVTARPGAALPARRGAAWGAVMAVGNWLQSDERHLMAAMA